MLIFLHELFTLGVHQMRGYEFFRMFDFVQDPKWYAYLLLVVRSFSLNLQISYLKSKKKKKKIKKIKLRLIMIFHVVIRLILHWES